MAYIAIVRSSLECASVIWDPHQENHKSLLEATQRRVAQWIENDYRRTSSVTAMLQSLRLEMLEERRRASRLVFLYKILQDEIAVPPEDIGIYRNP